MKRLTFLVLALLCIVLIFAGCSEEQVEEKYEIMIAEEIEIYEGKQLKLRPHLMDSNGNVVEARFVYSSSSESITVTQDGEIIINSIPNEDVYITIVERNTSAEKKIKARVIQSIQSIDGITNESNKLIEGTQRTVLGSEYKINVKTQLQGFNAKDYCTIKVTDAQGNTIDTFSVSYNEIMMKRLSTILKLILILRQMTKRCQRAFWRWRARSLFQSKSLKA